MPKLVSFCCITKIAISNYEFKLFQKIKIVVDDYNFRYKVKKLPVIGDYGFKITVLNFLKKFKSLFINYDFCDSLGIILN